MKPDACGRRGARPCVSRAPRAAARRFARLGLTILSLSASALVAESSLPSAAESRLELLSAPQSDKAKNLRPYSQNKAEKWAQRVQDAVFGVDPGGWYPVLDTVYNGGGITLGAGYRQFYRDNAFWNIHGMYSFRNYKLLEGGTTSKDRFNNRLTFTTRLGWRDATQVAYYGIGMGSKEENLTNFRFKETYAEGAVTFKPVRWMPVKGMVAFENWNTLSGTGSDPSIETVHTPATVPGLGADPAFLHSRVSAGIDWRKSPGYTRSGGLYELTLHDYHNTNGGVFSFRRLDGEVIQHVPLLRETWVLAARGRVQTTLNDNDTIPYFLLPSLGSGSDLRGYSSFRFRDRHSMLMNAEVRWIPAVGLDMAIFYDAGKVTSRRNDMSFKNLKSDVGIGARFHGPQMTPIRIDFAVGSEGWRLVFSGGPIF